MVHVLRKPLSEKTVAANVLAHGAGALNIDASRIATTDSLGGGRLAGPTNMAETCGGPEWDRPWMNDPGKREEYAQRTADKVARAEALGRWPSNRILEHDEECRCIGTKRVTASAAASGPTLTGRSESNSRGVFNGVESTPHYADAEGKETVAAWDCAPDCPVAALDEQSGVSKSSGGRFSGGNAFGQDSGWNKTNVYRQEIERPTDTGGASRFYKQVGGTTRTDSE